MSGCSGRCEALWRFTGEMFQPVEGLDVDWQRMEAAWRRRP